jgi:hypothetical protein
MTNKKPTIIRKRKRSTNANSTYKKLAVQWLNLPAGRQVKLCSLY